MEYTRMGNGKLISRLGFGCMRFPTQADGKIDRAAAMEMLDAAYKGGVNYFDTAYGYHDYESENFTGEALKRYPRDSYYLTTKLPIWLVETEEDVDRLFDEQRAKCGVDFFDFYLIHALDHDRWERAKRLGVYERLLKKKEQGLIGQLGFSYHGDIETFRDCVDSCAWDLVQIQINYVDYTMNDAKAYHDKLCEKNIPCVVMEPVRGGFLANLPASAQSELRRVNNDPDAKWALRWCLDMPNMLIILSGMSTLEQVRQNLELFSGHAPMAAEEYVALARSREALLNIKTVPCTACGYCMDCPFGVDIPGVFAIYNEYKLFGNPFRAKEDYRRMGEIGHPADACTRCGACMPMCPQGIEIPDRLAEIHREIGEIDLG